MTHIEKQGVALANLEHKLLMKTTKGEAENARLRGALEEITTETLVYNGVPEIEQIGAIAHAALKKK